MELGTSYHYKRSGENRILIEKKENFQYIPLIENLEWLLQSKDVYREVCTITNTAAQTNSVNCAEGFQRKVSES